MRRPVQLIVAVMICLFGGQARAQDWTVSRVTGAAWVQTATDAVALTVGMKIRKGSTIKTGPQSRALLVHAGDSMTMSPGTIVVIPARPDKGLKTTILQQVGQIALSIERRKAPHFSVQTPLIAAVVKGTEFTVTVSRSAATVGVTRGLVSVKSLASGETADVGPGQAAGVSLKNGPGLKVSGVKETPQVVPGPPQAAKVNVTAAPTASQAKAAKEDKNAQKAKDAKAGKESKESKESKSGKDGKGSDGKGGGDSKGSDSKGGESKGGGDSKGGSDSKGGGGKK